MTVRRAVEKLQEIARESERVTSILKAKDMMLNAALATRDPAEIEKARQELNAAFEASVDFKIKSVHEGDKIQRLVSEED